MKYIRRFLLSFTLLFCLQHTAFAVADPHIAPTGFCQQACIITGKASLDLGDLDKALVYLTAAIEEMPMLGDYILFWRSTAFMGKQEFDKALADLGALKKKFPDSPLMKEVRFREVELLLKTEAKNAEDILQRYINDYPADQKARLVYAQYLKASGRSDKAKSMFRDIYVTVTPYSKVAAEELGETEIRTADLLKKARNLNNAWLFKESERYLRTALAKKDSKQLTKEINEALALSLFRQKRYKESAALYSHTEDVSGRAKSLFRAGDIEGFEKELNRMIKSGDSRAGALKIIFGSRKRRAGDTETALKIFTESINQFPSLKEEAMWQKGWTYYRARDYEKALEIFSSLYKSYGAARYLYWKKRCLEQTGGQDSGETISYISGERSNNFYFLLTALRSKAHIYPLDKPDAGRCSDFRLPERISALQTLGFKKEARSEISLMASRSTRERDLICLSNHMLSINDFKNSIILASRVQFRDEIHDLYYPMAYSDIVKDAANANDIDHLLVLSIIREESRYATDARSIAGALGLMQMMPATASKLSKKARVSLGSSEELYDARTNVTIGAYYLATLVKHFGAAPPAIASYNAGEDRVKEWLSNGGYRSMDEFIEDIPYDETRNYVKKVMTSYLEYLRQLGKKDLPPLLLKSWNL